MADESGHCVVIPAYEAAETVGDVVRRARAHLPDVIVVNDGSLDGTGDAARVAGARVVDHPVNLGKGHALRTGMRYAFRQGFRWAVTLDADGHHDPDEISAFLAASIDAPDALILGQRTSPTPPAIARWGRWLARQALRVSGGMPVRDPLSGYRCYPIEETLGLPARSGRCVYELEVMVRAAWANMPFCVIDVRQIPSRSRRGLRRALNHGVRAAAVLSWLAVLRVFPPLRRPPAPLPPPPPADSASKR